MSNYASSSHTITWNKLDLTEGYLGASLSKAGQLAQMDIDLLGNPCVSTLADQSGEFTVNYRQGSSSLKKLDRIAAGQQLAGELVEIPYMGFITFKDPIQGDSFLGWQATLVSVGDSNWAEAAGERTVTFRVAKVINTDDPIQTMANLAGFIA